MSKDKLSGEQIKKIIEEATADARSKKGSANCDRGKSWKDGLITARELQTKQFEPVRIILPDLIPEGVTVLAGKPKIGKSWFALDVCVAVAGGRFVLGEVKPVQGYVLYLAPEDSPRRLKKRMEKIFGQGPWPEHLEMHTQWKKLDQGGLDDIEEWCKLHHDRRLIWIDTLVKVRPKAGRNDQAYIADYQAIEGLQQLAAKYQLGFVLNHHLRKMSSEDDAFDDVSGTLGLTGAADTIIVMKRHAGMAKIFVRGRDIEEGEFAAEFDRSSCRWRLMGDAAEVFRSKERQAILSALKEAARSMSVPEIMAATERRDRKATETLIYKMAKDGEVVRTRARGRWRHPDVPPDDDPGEEALSRTVRIVRKVGKRDQPIDTLRENGSRNPNANPNAAETVRKVVRISEPHKPLICKDNPVNSHDPNDPNGIEHVGSTQIATQGRYSLAPAGTNGGGPHRRNDLEDCLLAPDSPPDDPHPEWLRMARSPSVQDKPTNGSHKPADRTAPDDGLDMPTTLRRCHHCGKPGADRWDLNEREVYLHAGCTDAWADQQDGGPH